MRSLDQMPRLSRTRWEAEAEGQDEVEVAEGSMLDGNDAAGKRQGWLIRSPNGQAKDRIGNVVPRAR